ncbi:MAG: prepilin-type N-terminal cleavage/methylation domain-containing protein [Planctomycetaceae bacterium]|nr:prepilin-type N-terminal cleavage/methylation domain-containing protein [Planctomycetaceae bacterium]
MQHTFTRRRAFTLVELLVVVAILAIVIALAFPALALLNQSGRTANCVANLRSLQLASLAYAQDHAGWLIDARLPHGAHDQGSTESFVEVLSRKNYCDTSLIRSPLDTSPHWAVEQGGEGLPVPGTNGALRRTSYGLNNHLAREFSPWAAIDPSLATDRLSKVAHHAATVQLVLMAETGAFAAADHPHVEGWGSAPQSATIAASEVAVAAVSGGRPSPEARTNWSFLDGHVETLPFGSVYIDAERNRLDPAVSGLFERNLTAN